MAGKRKSQNSKDPKKESVYKELVSKLADHGIVVRREKLKQGFGWKVLSGSCVVSATNTVFVDSRLSQDDQIAFLNSKIQEIQSEAA